MSVSSSRTQVGIVGAGPAGLLLAQLLRRQGIECVVLESGSREYVEQRVRAGVLEQGSSDLLVEAGVGERLQREGLVREGIELRFDGQRHRIDLAGLTGGRRMTVYGQTEIVKDLIGAQVGAGVAPLFDATDVRLEGIDTPAPKIHYVHEGVARELTCDVIAGCDGYNGISRRSIPDGALRTFERVYPFGWLAILARAAPSCDELTFARHDRGFALHSLRSPQLSRLYLQVDPAAHIEDWSDSAIWEELHIRLATDDGFVLREGPVLEKSIHPMHCFVASPMQYGSLYLLGDAAHVVPPTGAKGLNLALADVRVLTEALADFFAGGDRRGLETYSERCLRRVWRMEHFSWWMTSMLHVHPNADAFGGMLQRSELAYVCSSQAAATTLAENYVGMLAGEST